MLNDEEAVEQAKRHGRHREKVEGDYHLAVILQKGQPALSRGPAALSAAKIPGDGPFRNDEAELLEFSVDLGGTPIWVLFCQAPDKTADLLCDLRPATAGAGSPAGARPLPLEECHLLTQSEDFEGSVAATAL